MAQVNCPVCTFINNFSNSHCECCDSPLRADIQENPNEEQFMNITGEPRPKAKEYLEVTNNDVDKAVALFFEDKDRGISNADYINQQTEFMNMFMQVINGSLRRTYDKPKNLDDLICQLLYTRGRNTPHYCEMCDSRAFLLCSKILSHKDTTQEIIRLIPQEDLEELKIDSSIHSDLVKEIVEKIEEEILPKVIVNLKKYFLEAYYNRDDLLKTQDLSYVEEYMDSRNGMEFRTIWDTLHQGIEGKIDETKISELLEKLSKSEEFHSYLNQSWESPVYNHPASQEALENLKKINLTNESEEFKILKDKKCAICMEDFLPDGREVVMLKCHSFCSGCILEWLENHNDTCPVCRKTVGEPVHKKQKIEDIN